MLVKIICRDGTEMVFGERVSSTSNSDVARIEVLDYGRELDDESFEVKYSSVLPVSMWSKK